MPADAEPLLRVSGVRAGYGGGEVLHGVDLEVPEGGLVALLGPNGAGKSTLLKLIAGFVRAKSGSVTLRGVELVGHEPAAIARCGVYLVPERRAVFPNLTVGDNLRLATAAPEWVSRTERDAALALFPRIAERLDQRAGTLSGGEQQMLALARAFTAKPVVLLLDEPSLGLAPRIVDEVFATIDRFRAEGITVVLVEQYVERALAAADHATVLQKGTVAWSGPAAEADLEVLAADYLGSG